MHTGYNTLYSLLLVHNIIIQEQLMALVIFFLSESIVIIYIQLQVVFILFMNNLIKIIALTAFVTSPGFCVRNLLIV